MNICLYPMTQTLCRAYFKEFENDPVLFEDLSKFKPFVYDATTCDAYWERQKALKRKHFAIMLQNNPIGELILKNIDYEHKSCELSIHLQRDEFKNKGYGTQAERLGIEYALEEMKIETVFADVIHKNRRSQRVLEKLGFRKTHSDSRFVYYRLDKAQWRETYLQQSLMPIL